MKANRTHPLFPSYFLESFSVSQFLFPVLLISYMVNLFLFLETNFSESIGCTTVVIASCSHSSALSMLPTDILLPVNFCIRHQWQCLYLMVGARISLLILQATEDILHWDHLLMTETGLNICERYNKCSGSLRSIIQIRRQNQLFQPDGHSYHKKLKTTLKKYKLTSLNNNTGVI